MKLKIVFVSITIAILLLSFMVFRAGTLLSSPYPSNVGEAPKDLNAQQVAFQSSSGNTLSGWFIPGQSDKGGILLMHGIGANRLQMLERARFLNKYGYSVLLFDFQGHGESQGKQVTFGYLESFDANTAFDFLKNKLINKTIGVIGVSLGGAAALLGNVVNGNADALVLESVYPTIEEAVANRLIMRLGGIGEYLVPLLTLQLKPRLGFSAKELRPIEKIAQTKGAVFIINGSADKHTTLSEAKRLHDNAHQPKEFWAVEGAAHIDIYKYKGQEYKNRILSFFEGHLKKTVPKP